MTSMKLPREGVFHAEPVKVETLMHELEEVTSILNDASVRLHVLEYHLARLEAEGIVAGNERTSASPSPTVDELSGMVNTYFDSPLQMTALWSMFSSNDPVQQQDAVRVLAAKRAHEKQRVS